MTLSDRIEKIIRDMLAEGGGVLEFSRRQLSDDLNCVPSQISYVLSTRFTNEHGFLISSQRGGGGFIQIRQVDFKSPHLLIIHSINSIGDSVSQKYSELVISNLLLSEVINRRDYLLLQAAVSNKSLQRAGIFERDQIRADILKNVLTSLILEVEED